MAFIVSSLLGGLYLPPFVPQYSEVHDGGFFGLMFLLHLEAVNHLGSVVELTQGLTVIEIVGELCFHLAVGVVG